MQNKKLYLILPLVVLLIAAAAFMAGRLLNGQAGALGFLPFGNGAFSSISFDMKAAPELPVTPPDATGVFVERQDNMLVLQTFSAQAGGGEGVVVSVDAASGSTGDGAINIAQGNEGPKVNVVITKETKVYKDVTQFDMQGASSGESQAIQQVVEAGSLDELGKQAMLTIWGRKNGDRIIAEVVLYSNPVMIQP